MKKEHMYLNHNDYSLNIRELKNLMKLFEINQLAACLHAGTLLGAIREKDFIKTDNDIDVFYISNKRNLVEVIKEFNVTIKPILIKNGYTVKPIYWESLKGNPLMLGQYHIIKNNITIDLWASWFDENDKFYGSCCIVGDFDKCDIFPLVKVSLHGSLYKAPNNYDKYLTFLYGDWRTPRNEGMKPNPYFYKKQQEK